MICDRCHQSKPDVCERIDPYEHEVNEETVIRLLCDSCEEELRDDI